MQRMKILSVLDGYEETLKEKQKEPTSLKETGAITIVKRSEAVGKRVIQTRWGIERERRSSEIEAGSDRLQQMSRCH